MRVLVLAPQPFFALRGTPIAVRMLLETLSRRGDTLDAVVYSEGEDIEIERCTFIRVPALPGTKNIGPGFSVKKLVTDAVMFPMLAWRLLRKRYDVIIAVEESAYMAMLLRPLFRVPYIFDVDSSIPEQINDKFKVPRWVDRILNGVEGATARNALAAIACCQALKETIAKHAPDLPIQVLEDVTMIGDVSGLERPKDVPDDKPVIMYVGNLESYQGVGLLLEGFALLDLDRTPARLVVIGGSDDHIAHYRGQADQLGVSDHVSFLGPRPVTDLGLYLSAAAITASPRTQGSNTPMKIYSYLDSGKPLLATRLLTHTQVLDDEIAMLVEPDAKDVARGLSELLASEEKRAVMGQAARKRVAAEFSPDAFERKLGNFLETEVEPRLGSRRSS